MPIEQLDAKGALIDEAALEAGCDPVAIRRLAYVNGVITDGKSESFLRGPVDQWVDEPTSLVLDHGIDSFVLWPDGDLVEQTGRFAEATRSSVTQARRI